jgi:hypothetical protein
MRSKTIVTFIHEDIDIPVNILNSKTNIVVFCVGDLYEKVLSTFNPETTQVIIFNINELEVLNEHRDLITKGNLDINSILPFNKLTFIRRLAKTNPFQTSHFVWVNPNNLNYIINNNIDGFLCKKIRHVDDLIIVPQNLAWHYRYLIDRELHSVLLIGSVPSEKDVYTSIKNRNYDLFNDMLLKKNIKVVIARYNEDVSWVRDLEYEYIIYNKNESENHLFENNLPNIGREGHTFFTYLIENYDNLPEYVCFLHGVPFDHCLDIIDKINNFNMVDNFLPLSASYVLGQWEWERTYGLADTLGLPYANPLKMISSCQSIVSKELILKTPKEMYEKLLNSLSYHVNPQEAYIIENLWPTIFNFNDELIPSCDNCRGYWGGC